MNAILNRKNRLLRLMGVIVLTLALAAIPAGAAFAADNSQAGLIPTVTTPGALFPPTAPENLTGVWHDDGESLRGEVRLAWEDSTDNINPACYALFMICWMWSFSNPISAIDAPTEYVVEHRPKVTLGRGGHSVTYHGRWRKVATVAAEGDTGSWVDEDILGMPPRTYDYRVKACNDDGCSGWSSTRSVRITYTWCAGRSPGTLTAFCER